MTGLPPPGDIGECRDLLTDLVYAWDTLGPPPDAQAHTALLDLLSASYLALGAALAVYYPEGDE